MRISDWSSYVCSSDLAHHHISVRHIDGRNHYFRATKNRLRSNRLRNPATILSVKGRHADTDVPYPPRGCGAARHARAYAALRLWRVHHATAPRLFRTPTVTALTRRRSAPVYHAAGPRRRWGRGEGRPT